MAEYSVRHIETAIGPLNQQSVLILGVAYRGNVRETAFSSARLLQEALLRRGARIYFDDPLFSSSELSRLGYTPLTADREDEIRAIILQSDHRAYQAFDFTRFAHCQVVLDGRGVLSREMIEALGIRYIAIGDGSGRSGLEAEHSKDGTAVAALQRGG
jgi:UDP-N-acetyl-D-mannosaminuronate dehydrogenase